MHILQRKQHKCIRLMSSCQIPFKPGQQNLILSYNQSVIVWELSNKYSIASFTLASSKAQTCDCTDANDLEIKFVWRSDILDRNKYCNVIYIPRDSINTCLAVLISARKQPWKIKVLAQFF